MSNISNNPFVTVDDDIVILILDYLTPKEALEAAVTCKQFLRSIETAATVALNLIREKHNPAPEYWQRVNNNIIIMRNPTAMAQSRLSPLSSRILLPVACTTPTNHHFAADERCGPSVLLPDGKMLAIVNFQDGLIRIFDTRTFDFVLFEDERTVDPELSGEGELVWYALLYSNGHLVLTKETTENNIAAVWELEYDAQKRIVAIHFRRKIHLGLWPHYVGTETAVAENGKMYILRSIEGEVEETEEYDSATGERRQVEVVNGNNSVRQEIEVYDIATGERVQAIPCNGIPKCNSMLLSSSSAHLLLFRTGHGEDDGIYALNMNTGLTKTSFLSGFGERGIQVPPSQVYDTSSIDRPSMHAYHRRCIDNSGRILYLDKSDDSIRVVSIDASGMLWRPETDIGGIRLGAGQMVKHVAGSANRVFICHADGDEMKIYEYDFMTGRKVRTMCTGMRTSRYDYWRFDRVFSNDTAVFCCISNIGSGLVMQSFLR